MMTGECGEQSPTHCDGLTKRWPEMHKTGRIEDQPNETHVRGGTKSRFR